MKRAAGFVIALAVGLAVLWLIKPVRELAMSIAASGAEDRGLVRRADQGTRQRGSATAAQIRRPRLPGASHGGVHGRGTRGRRRAVLDGAEARVTFAEVPEGRAAAHHTGRRTRGLHAATPHPGRRRPARLQRLLRTDADLETAADETGAPLSTSFAMRRIRIINGAIAYELADGTAMLLNEIDVEMGCDPETDPGWYAVNLDMSRRDLVSLKTTSRLNIDDVVLEIEDSTFEIALAPERYEVLPPQLQELVREYEVRGHLTLRTQGTLPLTNPIAGRPAGRGPPRGRVRIVRRVRRSRRVARPARSLAARRDPGRARIRGARRHDRSSTECCCPRATGNSRSAFEPTDVRMAAIPTGGRRGAERTPVASISGRFRGVLSDLRNQLRGTGDGRSRKALVNFPMMSVLVGAAGDVRRIA